MAQRTGVAVESLSALRSVAKMSGTNMDDVATAMQKLSRNMVEAQSGSGKTAEAMKMLGISVQDSSGHLKTADQVTLEVAKSLAQYQDGVGKTAVVMNVFGKAGANLLPMLTELAEKGSLNGKMTSEQAKQAYEFEKALNKLKIQFEGVFKSIALDLIPVITKLSQLFTTGMEVAAAYWAIFYGLPAVVALGTTALGSLQMTIALVKLEMAQGATVGSLFAASLGGIVGPAQWAAGALGKLQVVAGVLLAAFAGWEIGKWLSENFSWARQAGIYMVYGLIEGFEAMKFAAQVSWAGIKAGAVAAFDGVANAFAWVYEKIANGLKAIGADGMAKSLTDLSERLRSGAVSTSSLKDEVAQITEEYNKNRAALNADIDAQLAYERAGKGAVAATKEQKKELKETKEAVQGSESDYSKFTKAINEKIAAVKAEIEAGHTLNAAEQARVKLLSDLKDGTVKMTAAQIQSAKANIDLYESQLKILQSQQETKRYQEEIITKAKQVVDAVGQEADANERLVLTYGMTKSQIMQLDIARLEAKFNQAEAIIMTASEIDSLEKLIAAKKRSAEALAKVEGYDAAAKAAKDASDAWQRAADDINQSLSKAIMKGFTGTKGFVTDFMNQLKGLFSKLVLQPIIAPISGAIASMMVPGAAQASGLAGAAGTGSLLSGISSVISNGFSMLTGGLQVAYQNFALGATGQSLGLSTVVPGMAEEASLLVGGGGGALGTELTSLGSLGSGLATAAPWLLGAYALYKGLSMGEKQMTGQNVTGAFGANGAVDATRNVSWSQSGGFLRGDRSGTWNYNLGNSTAMADGVAYQDTASLSSDQAMKKLLEDSYSALKSSTTAYANALGLNAESIKARSDQINYTIGKDSTETLANIQKMMNGIADSVATELLPNIGKYTQGNETASATLIRLANDSTATSAILKQLGLKVFDVGQAGIDATERLIAASGGLQNLQQASGAYYQNFYTEAERTNNVFKSLTDQFSKAGLGDLPKSREAFRALVEQINKTGTPEQLAALMNMSSAFAAIVPVVDAVTTAINNQAAADNLAKQRRQMEIQIMELTGNAAGALAAKQKDEIATLDASLQPLQLRINTLTAAKEAERAAADLFKQRTDLQIGLLEALGDSEGALALRRKQALDATTDLVSKEILQRTYAAQNASAAAQKEAATQQAAAQAAQAAQQAAQQATQQAAQQAAQAAQQAAQQAQQEYEQRLSAAKSALQTAYNKEATALQNVISKMQSFGTAARAMQESMLSSGISPASTADQYARAKADMPAVIAAAKEGDQGSLAKLQRFVELSQQSNSDFVDYVRDFANVQNVLDDSATSAERLVKQNQSQLDLLKTQVDGLLNVNTSVLSVSDAIKALQDVMAGGMGDMATALNGQYKAKNPATAITTTSGMTPDQIYGGLKGEGELQAKRAAALKLNNTLTDTVQQYIQAQYEKEVGYGPGNLGNQYYMDLNTKFFGAGSFEKYARELGIFAPSNLPITSMLPVDGSHANGLDYVPFDGYRAELHRGERVQTASQVKQETELISEIRLMRAELRAVVSNTKDTYKTLDRWANIGLPATETA